MFSTGLCFSFCHIVMVAQRTEKQYEQHEEILSLGSRSNEHICKVRLSQALRITIHDNIN